MSESKKQTIMAFVRLACMFAASAAALFGVTVDANALIVGATCIVAAATFIWNWWKNNNVTEAASQAQAMLDIMKYNEDDMRDEEDVPSEDEVSD